jgi:hypothetical protein
VRCRTGLAAGALAAALTVLTTPAVASAAPDPSLVLVSETPVVTGSGPFTTELHVDGTVPAGEELVVTAYSGLTSRSAFAQAVAGHPGGNDIYQAVSPVSSLAAPDGDAAVSVPVNPAATTSGSFPSFNARPYGNGSVYPVTFQLASPDGYPVGRALTGFLVYSRGPNPGLPPLDVALTVPVTGPADPGPTATRLDPAALSAVAAVAGTLASHPGVPVTLAVSPDLLDRLDAGAGATDRQVVAELASRVGSGDELLAEPYFPVDLGSLAAAGLSDVTTEQWSEGDATLVRDLRGRPVTATAVVDDRAVGPEYLSALAALGVRRVVLPDGALTPLPASYQFVTFARPTLLTGRGVPPLPVVGTDPQLSGLLGGGGSAVLDARDVLAGLAVLQLERPSVTRGVALEVPPGAAVDPVVLDGVLAGLAGDPFARPVTVDGLFKGVPPPADPPTRAPVVTRPATPLPGATDLRVALTALHGLRALVPDDRRVVAPIERQLLSAASSVVTAARRAMLAAAVDRSVARAEAGVSLPEPSSVTLTSLKGTLPLTVLSNPGLQVHAELRVASVKLRFLPHDTSAGSCAVSAQEETCPLVLTAEATTVRLPVEARTTGVFPLTVSLTSPDGAPIGVTERDTVRSTAFSGVGVVLILLAALGLVLWWVRDIRHGRRARQLIDPPTGEVPVGVAPAGSPRGPGPASWADDDPVVADFFASPPAWEPASPSGTPPGPNS